MNMLHLCYVTVTVALYMYLYMNVTSADSMKCFHESSLFISWMLKALWFLEKEAFLDGFQIASYIRATLCHFHMIQQALAWHHPIRSVIWVTHMPCIYKTTIYLSMWNACNYMTLSANDNYLVSYQSVKPGHVPVWEVRYTKYTT